MKNPSEATLCALCARRGIARDELVFLGGGREDSDGVAYRAGGTVLKIISVNAADKNALGNFTARVDFMNYLGQNGVRIAYPMPDGEGNVFARADEGDTIFLMYVSPLAPGKNPESAYLAENPAFARQWGALTGKIHRLTRNYPVWKNLTGGAEFGYEDETRFFEDWCADETGKECWRALRKSLEKYPKTRENYGFIHNDNHQMNILADESGITLIDFDCAGCNFFVQDFVTPFQGMFFDVTGGFITPVFNPAPLRPYFDAFLNGYETENHIADAELRNIDTFVNYRRLILFTCLQDFLATQPELQENMRKCVADPPRVLNFD